MAKFDIIDIEVVDWADFLEAMGIPHPTNQNTFGDKPIKHHQQRSIELPDMSCEILVIWEGDTKPTDEEIIELARELFGCDEDDEEP